MKIGITALMLMIGLCGCADVRDIPKSIWGSSTRVLEDARKTALVKTYDKSYWDCYKAAAKVVQKKNYVLFNKDDVRGYMVIMGIPGSVDTTEVGVFFVEVNDQQTRIELSSLSTNAKRLLAKSLFHGMDIIFGLAPPDKEEGFGESEFQNGLTPEALVKAIDSDGFSIPAKESPLESLNTLLEDPLFYDNWLNKHRRKALPKEANDLIGVKEKTAAQVRELNRYLLQETYPTLTPRMKKEASAATSESSEPAKQ
jgi:hypothetical protein